MSELRLETPPSPTTAPHTTLEEDDIVGPPNITRENISVPGAFAAFGKSLCCNDENCRDLDCTRDTTQSTFVSKYPGIEMRFGGVLPPSKSKAKAASIGDTNETKSSSNPTPLALQLPPDPAEESEQFKTFVGTTICHCGIHIHTFTCKKPPKGWHGCRLCFDKALSFALTKL